MHRRAVAAGFSPDGRSIVFGRADPDTLGGSLFAARSRDGAGIRRLAAGGELPIGSTWASWDEPA